MPRVEMPFGYGGGDIDDGIYPNSQYDTTLSINMMPIYSTHDSSKSKFKLENTPAFETSFIINPTIGSSIEVLGSHECSNGLVVVCYQEQDGSTGDYYIWLLSFYKYTDSGPTSAWGLNKGNVKSGKVKITDNGLAVCLVDGEKGYFSDLYSTSIGPFQTITDPDFPLTPIDVVFIDTYFVWLDEETGRFYISENYATDTTDCVNALDFGVVEANPDKAIALGTISNELVIFGSKTIEFFYNSGDVDFPFSRNSGATQNIGAVSRFAINKIGNSLYFLGVDSSGGAAVFSLSGYQPNRISNRSIEKKLILRDFYLFDYDTYSFSYSESGSLFYCLRYREREGVLCYDASVGAWHIRRDGEKGSGTIYYTKDIVLCFGNNIVLAKKEYEDFIRVAVLNPATRSHDNSTDPRDLLVREAVLSNVILENKDIQLNYFELECQRPFDSPELLEVFLYISRDGGMTYGNPISMKMGASGSYKQRVRADMLGMGRDFVFKLESDSPVQQEWFTAYIDYEVMSE
jgi:hypothetical protein